LKSTVPIFDQESGADVISRDQSRVRVGHTGKDIPILETHKYMGSLEMVLSQVKLKLNVMRNWEGATSLSVQ
jgi:hypothetical protein